MFQELHEVLHPEGWSLTAALGAGKDTMEAGYDLQELNKYLDHVHLMCYDYHGKWDNQTGANAPLHSADPLDVNTVVCNHCFYSNSSFWSVFWYVIKQGKGTPLQGLRVNPVLAYGFTLQMFISSSLTYLFRKK